MWVRENASVYGIDTSEVGIMGFSAGGHLAMSAGCFHSTDFLERAGNHTDVSLRPSFIASIYPVVTMNKPFVHVRSRRGLLGDSKVSSQKMRDSLSLERHIRSNCPPVFMVHCKDDPVVPYENSVLLDSALSAANVNHRFLLYETGKHGFGISDYYGSPESRRWKTEFITWLASIYLLDL